MNPLLFTLIPDSVANLVFGTYPMDKTTASTSIISPLVNSIDFTFSFPWISLTPTPVKTLIPLWLRSSSPKSDAVLSNEALKILGCNSIKVTSLSALFNSSDNSTPINPAPITATLFSFLSFSWKISK